MYSNKDRFTGKNITVIGAGSWGTTLSVLLAEKGHNVKLWVRSRPTYLEIKNSRKNEKYTGNLYIPGNVIPFMAEEEEFGHNSEIMIFAVPSHALRGMVRRFYHVLEKLDCLKCILNVAKGFEEKTNLLLSQLLEETLPVNLKDSICVLSGPNIAAEIACKLPGVSVIASKNRQLREYLQPVVSTGSFRIYTNEDITGVQIGGSVKNIIAIAAGISDGLGYGVNTKASLITRGLYELSKFGEKMGANPLTFSGAAGMGDLIATCISPHSRNRNIGERISRGEKVKDILEKMYMVAEGVKTSRSVYEIAKKMDIEVPITECVYKIIYKNMSPKESVSRLMERKFKSEI
ncbi:MAG: NAD(P)-dependent glycerol-3-phosphate dehydrogenase [Actinobacteria bacterium]|nr:NAD(P)-dependent glycerol-3-phosphate dehydrogenase [Actinomycetota bacterium]